MDKNKPSRYINLVYNNQAFLSVHCLFVCLCGRQERQIKAATLAKRVSRSRDLAARPRTILLFFNPLIFLRGLGEGKAGKKHKAPNDPALRMTNLVQYLS